jgi:hypothetical protein
VPADDKVKPMVVSALVKDGWTITHDPYPLKFGRDNLSVDLAAERTLVAAERGTEYIAVEIKSFLGASVFHDFYEAFGQFLMYRSVMTRTDPARVLYLGIGDQAHKALRKKPSAVLALDEFGVSLVVVRLDTEEVVSWIRSPDTGTK